MSKETILSAIKQVALAGIPKDASVILFGSQARGDDRPDSDWDVLILIDKEKLSAEDHDNYSYPFWELGWRIDAMIHPAVYTRKDWLTKSGAPGFFRGSHLRPPQTPVHAGASHRFCRICRRLVGFAN